MNIIIILITEYRGAILDHFYKLLTAPQTVSNIQIPQQQGKA